jgi:signal transduction histidine kinase
LKTASAEGPAPRARRTLPVAAPWLIAFVLAALGQAAWAAEPTRNVLVLYSNGRLLPANVEVDRGLRIGLSDAAEQPIATFDEFLDSPRFDGDEHAAVFADYLRRKYARQPPNVILAASWGALDFLLRQRAHLFPDAKLLYMGVPSEFLRAIPAPPAGMRGIALDFDFAANAALAQKLHPLARHLVFVSGTSPEDRRFEAQMREAARGVDRGVATEFLSGLTEAQVLGRLRDLGPESVVVTLGYFRDGDGRVFTPREAVRAMTAVSGAPIYAPASTYLGTGAVGGIMPDYVAMGRRAGVLVRQQLQGRVVDAAVPEAATLALHFDWRQVQRWGIAEQAIPADAVMHFKEPTLWQSHPTEVRIAALVILFQAGLIVWLALEHRSRRRAEAAVQKQRFELNHAARLAMAGEMTASIAHEINQPLSAILSNADAADILLDSGADRRDALRAILADIRRDDLRASEVIRGLRTLLAKHETAHTRFPVYDAVRDLELLWRADAARRGVSLDIRLASDDVALVGDRIQIQQVLTNLVLNAMDAVAGLPAHRRSVVVSVGRVGERVEITVRDRGVGIAPEDLPRLFDSFFSTKATGMGLGLSISRTLVEAHGGRVRAENNADEGALFRVDLPAAGNNEKSTATKP